MIPERYITEWIEQVLWVVNKFIEQDLIVCRVEDNVNIPRAG